MKKFGSITIVISILHFLEDATLVALGRFTEVNFFNFISRDSYIWCTNCLVGKTRKK